MSQLEVEIHCETYKIGLIIDHVEHLCFEINNNNNNLNINNEQKNDIIMQPNEKKDNQIVELNKK